MFSLGDTIVKDHGSLSELAAPLNMRHLAERARACISSAFWTALSPSRMSSFMYVSISLCEAWRGSFKLDSCRRSSNIASSRLHVGHLLNVSPLHSSSIAKSGLLFRHVFATPPRRFVDFVSGAPVTCGGTGGLARRAPNPLCRFSANVGSPSFSSKPQSSMSPALI